MSISRREFGMSVLAAGVVAAGFGIQRASAAAKYRLRYGTAFPNSHPGAKRIMEAAEAIKKTTDGLVELQVYPSSQLGGEADMFSQTRSGALDFMSTSGVNQTVVPVGGINAVAFAFESYDKVWAAMDGDLGNHVRAAFGKAGLHVMPKSLDNGYRNITSSAKPIVTPDDLKGFKIRVPGNPLWVTLFKTLGASPTPIDFGELYAALQTKIVDGEENPLALIQSAKLYEVQKYISLTGHIWDGHYIFANGDKWASLPPDAQKAITEALSQAADLERQDIQHFNEQVSAEMTNSGVTINKVDTKPFRDALRNGGYYSDWKAKFGPEAWALLEKYSGPL
ncbi:ABC transporter substrate-binding protein [Aliidongia dinghuensis]|uniref:ABC transporter substrate-binding protein n=1 Tax=Aliidongia dinghuensis TaxID=1867774 RepID=A0A8J3E3H6_9PROT|nr:TRAP transporter substrate-binding protein [Aliidongia dinghuensis]GGF06673.1 ABC transporter substrate-binding protein [Aliidongia dinghuensis]